MTIIKELFDGEVLEQALREQLGIIHGYVKEFTLHWKEKPLVGPFGRQDGAVFKASVVPFWPPLWGGPTDPQEVRICFEATGYFHHGSPGYLEERAIRFRSGPAREFLEADPNRRFIDVGKEAGAIESGHYILEVFIRCIKFLNTSQPNSETRIAEWLKKIQNQVLKALSYF